MLGLPRVCQDLMTEGREHLETWDALSREFNKAQLLWRSQRERYPSVLRVPRVSRVCVISLSAVCASAVCLSRSSFLAWGALQAALTQRGLGLLAGFRVGGGCSSDSWPTPPGCLGVVLACRSCACYCRVCVYAIAGFSVCLAHAGPTSLERVLDDHHVCSIVSSDGCTRRRHAGQGFRV